MATVRPATRGDADALGLVHVLAWRAAYADVLDPAYLAQLDPAQRAAWWRARLDEDDPATRTLVLIEGGALQGFVLVGPVPAHEASPDEVGDHVGQVHALNLRPAAWGRGLGGDLLRAGERALADRGVTRAVLWVVTGNTRATRLYERCGWTATGRERTERIAGTPVVERRYARDLPPGS